MLIRSHACHLLLVSLAWAHLGDAGLPVEDSLGPLPQTDLTNGLNLYLNKRELYEFGIGKRQVYGFGIGKREPYGFGIGKREPYGFGIGKRDPSLEKRNPYNFGVGKRAILLGSR